jgi:hypothetical protein
VAPVDREGGDAECDGANYAEDDVELFGCGGVESVFEVLVWGWGTRK